MVEVGEPASKETAGRTVTWWWGLLTEPAVPFLLLAFAVLVKRDYLPDILIVAGAIVVISVDSARWGFREARAEPTHRRSLPRWSWPGALVLALVMSVMPRVSRELDLTFTVLGALVVWQALLPGVRGDLGGSSTRVAVPPRWWLWWVPALLFCAVEVASLAFQPAPRVDSPAHPSLSGVLEPLLSHWPVRTIAILVWFAAGWWLLRRIRAWAS